VYFPPKLQGYGWDGEPYPFVHKADSRMLVFLGFEAGEQYGPRDRFGYHVYVWTSRSLKKIKFIPQAWDAQHGTPLTGALSISQSENSGDGS
jgi:hypothetical protein